MVIGEAIVTVFYRSPSSLKIPESLESPKIKPAPFFDPCEDIPTKEISIYYGFFQKMSAQCTG
jgi:hypothetical protein